MNPMSDAERYTLFLNPYPDQLFLECPRCGRETHTRNRVLIVQAGSEVLAPVMTTCRYCTNCDLLIAHQEEIDASLHDQLLPEIDVEIGDTLMVIGTLDRSRLVSGDVESISPSELLDAFHPISEYVHFEMERDQAGNVFWVEVETSLPNMLADMPVPEVADLKALPQVRETWEVGVRPMQTWILDDLEGPYRPFGILVVNAAGPFVIFHDLTQGEPTQEEVRDALFKAMANPVAGGGKARRPKTVVIDDKSLAQPLKFALNALDVQCRTGETPEVDEALAELEFYLAGGQEPIPGLLDNPRVTPEQVGELFEAAAEFYDVAPWDWMLDEDLIAVRYPVPDGDWRFASVMGYAGMEFGLAVFERLSDYDRLATMPPETAIGMMDYRSLTYDDVTAMPFPDVEAVDRYGWDVAAEDAYPIPVIFTRREEVKRPGPAEIEWYIVTLRAIVTFFDEYWPDDIDYVPEPVSRTFVVPLGAGKVEVELRYPAELMLDEV